MTNIKLDCFNQNDYCQVMSTEKAFVINNPLERDFLLEIFNHSNKECFIKMGQQGFKMSNNLELVNLRVVSNGKILFQDSLLKFFTKETLLGSITSNSSASYFFSIDLLDLLLEEKQLATDFDLLFDFDCKESIKQSDQLVDQFKKANVLSASSSTQEEAVFPNSLFKSSFFLFLLSSLFVIIFFVIMRFINGQKKKKQAKAVV